MLPLKPAETPDLIVFDFDGTIADSLDIFIEAANRLATDFGYQQFSTSQISFYRALSSREMIRHLGMPGWKLPFFLQRLRKELYQLIGNLQFVDGMREVLLDINQQGYRLGVVTSNSRQNVEIFLNLQGLHHLFEFIYGGQLLFGKAWVLSNLARRHQIRSQQIVFIGDETRDVKAAKQVGLTSIAVSWGFNDRNILTASAPDVLIDRPEQLLAAIAQLRSPLRSR